MLKFFENRDACYIIIDFPLSSEDGLALTGLLKKKYEFWHIEFNRVYSVGSDIVNVLYKEIFENMKDISITVHKHKLARYLNTLGFRAIFESSLKKSIVNIDNIEVVLIGGSADSSQKIFDIIGDVILNNLTLVIVQHVESDKVGVFDEILQKNTKYKVSYAKDGEQIKKSRIYIAPNGKHLKVEYGCFLLSNDDKYNFAKPSISVSYESFSSYYKESLLIIQECGYASDGVDKLEFLKKNGSKIVIQDIHECEAKPMVINALKQGIYDYVLTKKDIITYINFAEKKLTEQEWIKYLLEMIYKKFGYDFRLYQKEMINRRLEVFMLNHEIKNVKDAVGSILFNRNGFISFFLEVSINVTELFRNPNSFKDIAEIFKKSYKNANTLKIWSAGCSSGKEAYSVAIILDIFGKLDRSIIYATDFNSIVLEEAKNGIYSYHTYKVAKHNFEQIGLGIMFDDYILKNDNFITINEKIRDKILFFEHNLATDSSFNEFDIIICRNVIIYFDDDLQQIVFKLFYDSLRFGGYLVLGESEMMHTKFRSKFKLYNDTSKIYIKVD